jgi:hypothetical protein
MGIKLKGSTDGSVTLQAPADTSPTGTDKTLTLPTTTGSANQFVKNGGTAGELEYSSMIETSTGVGIGGVTSPFDKLQVRTVTDANFVFSSTGGTEASFEIFNNAGSANTPLNYRASEHKFKIQGNEKMRLDSSGRLLINTTTDIATNSASGSVHMAAAGGGKLYMMRNDGSTEAGDDLGMIRFYSNDGTEQESARFEAEADAAHGTNNKPGRLVFSTTASSGSSPQERMRISSTGKTTITGASNGELQVKAGSSSGDDIIGFLNSGGTQRGNITYDTDNNFLFFNVNQTERMRIQSNGTFTNMVGVYNDTTGGSANVNVNSSGSLMRSTSSAKYKTSIETLEDSYADALLNCRPVWYRSLCSQDNPDHGFWGFIAEEVAEIDPRLVHWKTTNVTYDENGYAVETPCDPEAEGVQYERFVPHLVNLIKRQKTRIETLETQNTAQQAQIDDLLARVTALEAAE